MSENRNEFCLRCLLEEIDDQELTKAIKESISALPKELVVSDKCYRERLSSCKRCTGLVNGLCRFCGCFVEVRALKKSGTCPNPHGSAWKT